MFLRLEHEFWNICFRGNRSLAKRYAWAFAWANGKASDWSDAHLSCFCKRFLLRADKAAPAWSYELGELNIC